MLPAYEQAYFKQDIFGDKPQVSFVAARYGAFDGAIQACHENHETIRTLIYSLM